MLANREKVMMSCVRPQNIILRKQDSLNCDTRERRVRLQKQLSVDQHSGIQDVAAFGNKSVNCQPKYGNTPNKIAWNGHDQASETSLRIFTAIKNKTISAGTEPKDECVLVSAIYPTFRCFAFDKNYHFIQ